MIDQGARILDAALVLVLPQNGYECLRKSAFGTHPAQQGGKLEGNKKSVRCQACTKGSGKHEIADKPENAGE